MSRRRPPPPALEDAARRAPTREEVGRAFAARLGWDEAGPVPLLPPASEDVPADGDDDAPEDGLEDGDDVPADVAADVAADGARPELEDGLEDGAEVPEAEGPEDGAEVIDLAARRPHGAPHGAEGEDAPRYGARRVPDAAEVARLMREWGIDKWRAVRAWERMNPDPDDDRAPVECPERIAVLPRVRPPAKGRPAWSAERTPDTLRAVFELRPWRERLRWDAFNLRADLRGPRPSDPWAPWGDGDALTLRADLCADLGPDWGAEDVRGYAAGAARLTEWHPVRAYLRGLRWDGVPRIGSWVPRFYGAPDTALMREIGARWLIGAVARVMRPGCKMDTVLTLAGPQGSGKSRSLEALAGGWFSDSPLPIGDKDGAQTIVGTWIWELAELSDVQKKTFETVKAFLSSATDRYRPSYGRRGDVESVPRQTVFCATVNPEEGARFLRDRTGNRRFWLVPVARTKLDQVDVPALEAERDQLWAEAVAWFDAGERWHLPPGLEVELEDVQEDAQGEIDPWASPVMGWLYTEAPPFFTTAEVAKLAVGLENARLGHTDAGRLAGCLVKAGCKAANRRRGGVQVKGWAWDRPETEDTGADEGAP